MITVTLTPEEVAARSLDLAQYANKLAELADREEDLKAQYKSKMADIKERRLEISSELRRLSRAVRLGVEERKEQQVLFEEEQRQEELRQQQSKEAVDGFFHTPIETSEQASEAAEIEYEDQAVREAKKFSEIMGEEGPESDAEWFASLTTEEREKYYAAPCKCGHSRDWHTEEDEGVANRECSACANLSLCQQYHCPACDTKAGHQATCEHYVMGEGTPVQKADDFTAKRCDECKMIDGGHKPECPKSGALTFDDYLAYARVNYKRNHQSYARKTHLRAEPDLAIKVRKWIEEQQQV